MEQVEIFCAKPENAETEINAWLSDKGDKVKIVRVLQSQSPTNNLVTANALLVVSIFYEQKTGAGR